MTDKVQLQSAVRTVNINRKVIGIGSCGIAASECQLMQNHVALGIMPKAVQRRLPLHCQTCFAEQVCLTIYLQPYGLGMLFAATCPLLQGRLTLISLLPCASSTVLASLPHHFASGKPDSFRLVSHRVYQIQL